MHEKYLRVAEIRSRTDALFTQLSEGEYRSLDTWTNNLVHMKTAFDSLIPYMTDSVFLAWLKQHDAVMVSEIAMTGRALMALHTFFRVASEQPR